MECLERKPEVDECLKNACTISLFTNEIRTYRFYRIVQKTGVELLLFVNINKLK